MQINTIFLMMGGGEGSSPIGTFVMFGLIFVVMYFFMIRPQQKKVKEQKNFRETIGKGDKIVTIGGMHGRITDVKENTFIIDVGNGIKMEIEKSAISMELTAPLNAKKQEKAEAKVDKEA